MRLAVVAIVLGALVAAPAGAGAAPVPALYKNCKAVNAKYPHGVGRANAKDKTKSGRPVTNFKRSTKVYTTALKHNKRLDGDKDGVACEKK